jgi:hypothetical protein
MMYPHVTPGVLENISDSNKWAIAADQVAYAGVGGVIALSLTIFLLCYKYAEINKHKFIFGLFPLIAYLFLFIFLLKLFWNNTYYAFYLIAALLMSVILLVDGYARAAPHGEDRRSLLMPMIATVFFSLTPAEILSPKSKPWSSPYAYVELRNVPEICDPKSAQYLARLRGSDDPLYLDCAPLDPTCRTSLRYVGQNLQYADLLSSDAIEPLRHANAAFLSCPRYSNLMFDQKARDFLAKASTSFSSLGDWVMYRF